MKPEQYFVGNINKCTKYETQYIGTIGDTKLGNRVLDFELYKENAVLVKIPNGDYVDIENIKTILDWLKIYQNITKNSWEYNEYMIPTSAWQVNDLFVDESSLKPYFNDERTKDISVRRVRKLENFDKNLKK